MFKYVLIELCLQFLRAYYNRRLFLQLKHASRYVHDLLNTLAKHLEIELIQYLLGLVSSLQVASHNKQTLSLALVLTRIVWNAALSSQHQSEVALARRNSPTSSTAVVGGRLHAVVPVLVSTIVNLENGLETRQTSKHL